MNNSKERFSGRVENYVKYRPGYPQEMLELFIKEMKLQPDSAIADLGSGTGISAKFFLDNGNTVYGVEPNRDMRLAAEQFLADHPKFISVNGTAESTTLADNSVDTVIAAQAFHWFDPEPTREEIKRIVKPGGYAALIWNNRSNNADEFHIGLEDLILKHGRDYKEIRHEQVTHRTISNFFQKDIRTAVFQNEQVVDEAGLHGRVVSSSYMPNVGEAGYEPMKKELDALFAKHAEKGRIRILYNTSIYYCEQ